MIKKKKPGRPPKLRADSPYAVAASLLRRFRLRKKMSVAALAKAAGVPASSHYDYERGVTEPPAAVVAEYDRILETGGRIVDTYRVAYRRERRKK